MRNSRLITRSNESLAVIVLAVFRAADTNSAPARLHLGFVKGMVWHYIQPCICCCTILSRSLERHRSR